MLGACSIDHHRTQNTSAHHHKRSALTLSMDSVPDANGMNDFVAGDDPKPQ